MLAAGCRITLASMNQPPPIYRVEVTIVGAPPARQVGAAVGVTEVDIAGPVLRCLICGSFQPLLEALRGYEVLNITSFPTSTGGD